MNSISSSHKAWMASGLLTASWILATGSTGAQCIDSLTQHGVGGSINLEVVPAAGFDLSEAQEAADLWQSGCPDEFGSGFPDININGFGSLDILVTLVDGPTPERQACGEINITHNPSTGLITGAHIVLGRFDRNGHTCEPFSGALAHELGHLLGMGDSSCSGNIMGMPGWLSSTERDYGDVTAENCLTADEQWQTPMESGPCAPGGTSSSKMIAPCGGGGGGGVLGGPIIGWNTGSPLVLDLAHDNFRFTDVDDGVVFDLDADGGGNTIAWTQPDGDDAFLVLDRNGNGLVDDGTELFGNFTAQPPSEVPNGFFALAVFDSTFDGGNADGMISPADLVYPHLRLWIDQNHDGYSQLHELITLAEAEVQAIGLNFRMNRRHDRHGNVLLFNGQAWVGPRWRKIQTTDVFFTEIEE